MSEGPMLVGTDGFVRGEEYRLEPGSTTIIGRSRNCDISLRRCKAWLELESDGRETDADFKTVSRKHIRISYYDHSNIEVEDLSSNGTYVDGKRIGRTVITDLRERIY